jgi:outer membrane protein
MTLIESRRARSRFARKRTAAPSKAYIKLFEDALGIKYDLASALIAARANRPFLKAQRSAILASVENITVQAAGFQPAVTADVGWEQRNAGVSNNLRDTVHGWFLGLQGSWSIFDGLLTYGRVKQARAQLEQAKVTYDDSVRQVELEVAKG